MFAIVFGHEIFIWFFFVPILEYKKTGHTSIKKTFTSFIKSPIIIAILIGLLINVLNLYDQMDQYFLGRWFVVGVFGTLALSLILLILPQQDAFFVKAFIAFLILPPPYILPIFMNEEAKKGTVLFQ